MSELEEKFDELITVFEDITRDVSDYDLTKYAELLEEFKYEVESEIRAATEMIKEKKE